MNQELMRSEFSSQMSPAQEVLPPMACSTPILNRFPITVPFNASTPAATTSPAEFSSPTLGQITIPASKRNISSTIDATCQASNSNTSQPERQHLPPEKRFSNTLQPRAVASVGAGGFSDLVTGLQPERQHLPLKKRLQNHVSVKNNPTKINKTRKNKQKEMTKKNLSLQQQKGNFY